jgi:lipoprotein-anchoring transpeptidase ErfK/SrfK
MSRPAALSVIVAGTLVVGALAGVVLTRMLSPVFAFAASTQQAGIHGDASDSPTVSAYSSFTPIAGPSQVPNSWNPCAENKASKRVIVSISKQYAWACAGSKTVFQTAVTTGRSTPTTQTPAGHFTVHAKLRNTVLTPDTGEHYFVKYWIAFSGNEYGFHDSPWQKVPYGSSKYRTGGSHGCVHVPLKSAKWLYSWVKIGTAVTIA